MHDHLVTKLKNIYHKICNCLSIKNITWMSVLVFILILVPICLCSFVNRASGDDFGYGALTRNAWVISHSLGAVFKAAANTVRKYYYGWQGTWFSIFLFSLQPEVFHQDAYVIVAFLMLFLWISTTCVLFHKLLKDYLRFDKYSITLLIVLFLFLCISFVPRKKSAIFWYNGCAHYMIPFCMCQMVIYWLLKYCEQYRKRYLVGIIAFMTLLGGANYQAALYVLIVAVYFMIGDYWNKRDGRIFWVSIPVVTETVGLIISMKSPGNSIRAGEDFGFSVSRGVNTIFQAFVWGINDIVGYARSCPMVFVGLLILFFVLLEAVKNRDAEVKIKCPFMLALSMFCLYSAMQAPEIYAGVEVSGGVKNTNFQMFMIMMTLIMTVVAEIVGTAIKKKAPRIWDDMHAKIVIPAFVVCFLLMLVCRSDIKESTSWISMEYIASGQAKDYKEQMIQLTELMTDDSVQDVVVPYIYYIQGPLMHMPVTEDPEGWMNTVICQFYGKRSVVAIPREEWVEQYGK